MLRLFTVLSLVTVTSAVLSQLWHSLFLRVFAVLIGLTVVSLYLFFRRSLSPQRGQLRIDGLKENVEVYWDHRGVPHIYAHNLHDLYMAQGYVTARDRLWSMDMDRRLASGRLAELFGAGLLSVDKHFRTLGLRRAAELSLALYPDETLSHLEAYAAGVNAFMATRRVAAEFRLLRYSPAPWTVLDSITIGKLTAYGLGGNMDTELFRARLVQAVGTAKAAELFWLPPDIESLRILEESPLPDVGHLVQMAITTVQKATGSNSWVAAGSRTESRVPVLANDPHLPVRNPAMWYQSHLVGPDGMDLVGVALPGLPGILLGHGREFAWGMTPSDADVQDLFLEKLNPAAPDEYLVQERWEKARVVQEVISVRGQQAPVQHEVLITRHGPIVARGQTIGLALAWTALEATTDLHAILQLNRAHTWTDFRAALAPYQMVPANVLFAGRDGTIALRATGRIPVRAKGDGQAPAPGWTGEYDWIGVVPFDELPERVNPPEGYLVAAAPHAAERITERLRGATALNLEKMQSIQTDTVNLQARSLLQPLLKLVQQGLAQGERFDEKEKRALLLLSGWECDEPFTAPEPALWHQWYLFLMEELFRPQMGLALYDQFVYCGMAPQIMDRLLLQAADGEESAWIQREGDSALPRLVLRSFRRAVAVMAAKQGSRPDRWRWGREHLVRFAHPLSRSIGRAASLFFDLGPYPVGGSGATVNQQGYNPISPFHVAVASSWRHVVDLYQPEQAIDILAPGQSEHPLSAHYSDQLQAYLRGEYPSQLYRHRDIRQLPVLVLQPGGGGVSLPGHAARMEE